jgi:hypothetical protein
MRSFNRQTAMTRSNPATSRAKRRQGQATSKDGVDLTLIRWMLSLWPSQRLSVLSQAVNSVQQLRHGQARR